MQNSLKLYSLVIKLIKLKYSKNGKDNLQYREIKIFFYNSFWNEQANN